MPTKTKAELLAENERLQRRVAALERARAKNVAASREIRQLRTDLLRSEQQQTATAEILRVISRSRTDIQPVMDAIADNARRLCGGVQCWVVRYDGKWSHLVAYNNASPEVVNYWRDEFRVFTPRSGLITTRAIFTGAVAHVPDIEADPDYEHATARKAGYRSALGVPLVMNGRAIGAIAVSRREARPFSEAQIELLRTFADQAVIAIENVRLLTELQARNAELSEALEQQTATADILKVISSSPTDTQPVFDAVAESAARLCGAYDVAIRLVEGNEHRAVAHHGPIPVMPPYVVGRANPGGRVIIEARTIHIHDVSEAHVKLEYPERWAGAAAQRTFLGVPLLREGKAIGLIVVRRLEVRPFTDKEIQLLETFADQAVIAIENVRLFKELDARNRELTQSLERQTVTSEVLKIISRSTFDLEPVLHALLDNAARLCRANRGVLFRQDGDVYPLAASYNATSELQHIFQANPIVPDRGTVSGRAMLERQVVHVADVLADPDYQWSDAARVGNYRTVLGVPLLREGIPIGVMGMTRDKVEPFTDQEIALVNTFADQAVIAIENVRLFKELRARNAELSETLEQQTATADILKIISSSPTDTQPVFDAIVKSCARLFGNANSTLRLVNENRAELTATTWPGPENSRSLVVSLGDQSLPGARAMIRREVIHVADVMAEEWISPLFKEVAKKLGFRALIVAPMVRDNETIGMINVTRGTPAPFSEREIALLSTFADQAVIAIENVRLFKELAARNAEITEALEQQTATSEILRVISRSPTDIQPVFDAILENATRLCDAHMAILRLYDGERFRRAAQRGFTPEFAKWILAEGNKYAAHSEGWSRQMVAAKRPIHILDYRETATYRNGHPPAVAVVELGGVRTLLAVPMQKDDRLLGAIVVFRPEVREFTQKQIDLVSTFADQAVIAIENVRLFKELEARTDSLARSVAQLTALGEVGQALSSTLDLETVLKTIASRAVELSGQDAGVIYEYDPAAEVFELRAAQNFDAQLVAALRGAAIRKGVGAVGTCAVTREPAQVPDTHAPHYPAELREILDLAGFRAALAVPLLREDQIIGALMLIRKTPGSFGAEVVQLLQTFASQSALAIQNARLFREIADKGRQLEVASRHKSDFLASMSHELRTPLNAILGFIELILDQIYGEVPADLQEPLADIQASGKHLLRLINNVLDLAKIEAGRMELALTEYSVQDTVESVRQTLKPLAADKGLEFLATVPPDLPFAHGDPGRITQCLMNLAGNSLKFTKAGKVEISVEQQGSRLVFRVADTGIGIAPDKIDSLFTEFKQTDATIAGEYGGTGLGLSISRKFVEMHGGRIWVESEPGRGSTFAFELPLRAGEPT